VFLPYFSEVAIFGFRAKLLDQKISEVERILTHLKSLAAVVGKATYQLLHLCSRPIPPTQNLNFRRTDKSAS